MAPSRTTRVAFYDTTGTASQQGYVMDLVIVGDYVYAGLLDDSMRIYRCDGR